VIYGLLKNGDIDLYGEFTGTLLSTIYKKTPSPQRMITYGMVQKQAQAEDLDATRPAEAQDVNGFYVTKENADKYGLVNMSDLTKTTTAGAP
jgi:glycine betaine/choline ABC-type transport system substrate-binding protein